MISGKNNPNSILGRIGNTPLVELNFLFGQHSNQATILGKLEYLNPGGSIKDRSALYMIEQAEEKGLLRPGGTIVEASSGNQGIALAMIGALKGYQVVITVPNHTSAEKVSTLKAYGAEVLVCEKTESMEDSTSYHSVAVQLANDLPNSFMPDQYFNTMNPEAHYFHTGPEIWEQTAGKITHFICGMGSCGTMTGIGRYLKEQNPNICTVGVDAANSLLSAKEPKPYQTEGLGIDIISDTFDRNVVDHIVPIEDCEAFQSSRKIAKRGLMLGPSSGAVLHIAQQHLFSSLTPNDLVVCILADSGRAYLTKLFSEEALFRSEEKHSPTSTSDTVPAPGMLANG